MAIELVEANRAICAAQAKAKRLALKISVTVCDADGRLITLQRMDGALAEASGASIGKAIVSAKLGRPSGDETPQGPDYWRASTAIGEGFPFIRRPGGLPIIRSGQVEGAIGVAGAASDEEDEECALAGIGALEKVGNEAEA